MSYYVRREGGTLGHVYVGPIRSLRQAERERAAWIEHGREAEVLASTAETRAEVRAWQRRLADYRRWEQER